MKTLLFVLLLSLTLGKAYACQPCETTLGIEQTIAKADLIIEARKVSSSKKSNPEFITLKIKSIIKGDYTKKRIIVRSYHGMCSYGIVIDKKNYLVFLQLTTGGWDAIDNGCSVKTLPVINGLIQYKDMLISPNEFKSNYLKI